MKNTTMVEIAVTRSGAYHVGALTRDWTKEERTKLDDGDLGAIDALRDEALIALRHNPDDSEMFFDVIE